MLINKKTVLFLIFVLTMAIQSSFSQTTQWRIIWSQNDEDDMASYLVFKGELPNPTNQIATVNHPDTVYVDSNLEKGVLYYYRLKARDTANNDSEFSDTVSAAIPKIDFGDIQNTVLTAGQVFQFDLDDYVYDPDHSGNQLQWTIPASSVLTLDYNASGNVVTVTAPTPWESQVTLQFEAMDPDSFFDVASLSFYSDSASVPNEPGPEISAFPVPYRPDEHGDSGITFDNIPINSTLVIYNFLGEPVFKASGVSNRYTWTVVNDASKEVNSGLYLYHIKSKSKTSTGKLVIIR